MKVSIIKPVLEALLRPNEKSRLPGVPFGGFRLASSHGYPEASLFRDMLIPAHRGWYRHSRPVRLSINVMSSVCGPGRDWRNGIYPGASRAASSALRRANSVHSGGVSLR
jgi:hypothetical protein